MPSIASLYIEPLSPTGAKIAPATGFVVRNSVGVPYLVTNRHVVTGRNSMLEEDKPGTANVSALRVFFPSVQFGVWFPVIFELWDPADSEEHQRDHRPNWLEHPDLGWKVDVIALALPDHLEIELHADHAAYYPAGPVLPRLAITDELYVIGFPFGFNPFKAPGALGVWTRGTIAWHPGLDWQGRPATLLDCRARPGQSGSPVLFYADEFTRFTTATGQTRNGSRQTYDLIGIYSGRIVEGSDIGIVWKRNAIDAIVERGRQPHKPLVTEFNDGVDVNALLEPPSGADEDE